MSRRVKTGLRLPRCNNQPTCAQAVKLQHRHPAERIVTCYSSWPHTSEWQPGSNTYGNRLVWNEEEQHTTGHRCVVYEKVQGA